MGNMFYKVGQVWQTQNGSIAVITEVDSNANDYPAKGILYEPGCHKNANWTRGGRFLSTALGGFDLTKLVAVFPWFYGRGVIIDHGFIQLLLEKNFRIAGAPEGEGKPETPTPKPADAAEAKAEPAEIDFKVGEQWFTRDGRTVQIDKINAPEIYPIQGEVIGGKRGERLSWNRKGRYTNVDALPRPADLVRRVPVSDKMAVFVTNTPRAGEEPFIRDRSGPPTPRAEPIGLKAAMESLESYAVQEMSLIESPLPENEKRVMIKDSIADEAKRIVAGVRRKQYGTPERAFDAIARYWTAYFQNTGRDITVTAQDVSPLMRLMKEGRLNGQPDHRDSLVDLIGYTLTDAEMRGIE